MKTMRNFIRINRDLVKIAKRFDHLGYPNFADQADQLNVKLAQIMVNPLQKQVQTLMFSVNQLNERLKQIEESMGDQVPSQQINNDGDNNMDQGQYVLEQQQAQQNLSETNNNNNTITQQLGDFQVSIGPDL
jgi:hypothetical protein